MAEADPAPSWNAARPGLAELILRVLSALVLAPVAIGVAWLGGWPFVIFWGLAALGVLWEWTTLIARKDRQSILMVGAASVLLAVALAGAVGNALEGLHENRLLAAVTVIAMGMLAAAALAPRAQRFWVALGIPYAGALGIAPVVLRSDVDYGFAATVILYASVWSTDILAYFIGRALGGPKLFPQISPKKTWSGAIGGTVGAVVVVLALGRLFGLREMPVLAVVAFVLSVATQVGDLFESFLKRRFRVKDAGQLIPGHGGLMDRLDGFVAAATVAVLIGLCRGGLGAPGRALVVW
jgi:phosphatidate cytidylyltransferase